MSWAAWRVTGVSGVIPRCCPIVRSLDARTWETGKGTLSKITSGGDITVLAYCIGSEDRIMQV